MPQAPGLGVTLDMAGIILTAAGLGFLGLGAQPPLPEWGAMIADGDPDAEGDLLARVRAFLNQREAAPNGNAEGRS